MPVVFERAGSQTKVMLEAVRGDPQFPRTLGPDGKVRTVKAEDWTSGFFPGTLWLLHEYDPAGEWKNIAWEYTRRLEVIRHFNGNHDGGFMLGCSYGNALRLDPSDESRAVLRDAAAALATRYIPKLGMIRSWDHKPYVCPVIIDNMMNLELLGWAAKNGGDSRLREIAVSHADHTLKNHFRPDGSAYHVLDYDPETSRIRMIDAKQGADVRTAWARGQAWALYGFTMMHRETGKPEYLACAEKVAAFIMNHPDLPKDGVPMWDFGCTHTHSASVARMAARSEGQSTWSERTKPRSTERRRRWPRTRIHPLANAVDALPKWVIGRRMLSAPLSTLAGGSLGGSVASVAALKA